MPFIAWGLVGVLLLALRLVWCLFYVRLCFLASFKSLTRDSSMLSSANISANNFSRRSENGPITNFRNCEWRRSSGNSLLSYSWAGASNLLISTSSCISVKNFFASFSFRVIYFFNEFTSEISCGLGDVSLPALLFCFTKYWHCWSARYIRSNNNTRLSRRNRV